MNSRAQWCLWKMFLGLLEVEWMASLSIKAKAAGFIHRRDDTSRHAMGGQQCLTLCCAGEGHSRWQDRETKKKASKALPGGAAPMRATSVHDGKAIRV